MKSFKVWKKGILIMAIFTMAALFGCSIFGYQIGKNPKLEELTGITVYSQGMPSNDCFNLSIFKRDGKFIASSQGFYGDAYGEEIEVETTESEWLKLCGMIEGCQYVRIHRSKLILDGTEKAVTLSWLKSPDRSYKVQFSNEEFRAMKLIILKACGLEEKD